MCDGLYGPRSQGAEAGTGESESGKEGEPIRIGGHSPGVPTVGGGGSRPPRPSGQLCRLPQRKGAFLRASAALLVTGHRPRGYTPRPRCAGVGARLALTESEKRHRATEAGSRRVATATTGERRAGYEGRAPEVFNAIIAGRGYRAD